MDETPVDPPKPTFESLLQAFQDAVERGETGEAEAISLECLALADAELSEEPSEELRLVMEAHEREDRADWAGAETLYLRILELADAEGHEMRQCKAHGDLSALYHLCGRQQEALEQARAAVETGRLAEMVPLLAPALEALGRELLACGDVPGALAVANESVVLCADDKLFELLWARGLTLRGRCAVELGDLPAAEADLKTSYEALAPHAEATLMAGYQSGLANWWEVTSRLRSARQDLTGAAEALARAVEFRRNVSYAPQLAGPYKFHSLAKTLHRYAAALAAAGDAPASAQAGGEARAIEERLGVPRGNGTLN